MKSAGVILIVSFIVVCTCVLLTGCGPDLSGVDLSIQ